MEKHVIVVEYPKSGGSWLVGLLGDCLDLPKRDIYVSDGFDLFDVTRHPWYRDSSRLGISSPSVIKSHEMPKSSLYDFDNKILHLVRDGRDVIISKYFYEKDFCVKNGIYQSFDTPWDIYLRATAKDWRDFVLEWRNLKVPWFRYEDLLANPLGTLSSILDFLQVPVEEGRKIKAIDSNTKEKFRESLAGAFEHNTFVRKGIVGDWKNHFSSADLTTFYEIAGSALERYGYSCADTLTS